MRKIILGVAVTLDGLIEGPNGEYDWCFTDQDYGMNEFLKSIDAILYGRKSYEVSISMDGGNPFQGIRSYVFSHTLKAVKEGFELVNGDAVAEVKKLKASEGKNIWLFGGAQLTTSLMNAQLVDEVWLSVHPILLGAGKPLFSGIAKPIKLELLDNRTYESGLVSLTYAVMP